MRSADHQQWNLLAPGFVYQSAAFVSGCLMARMVLYVCICMLVIENTPLKHNRDLMAAESPQRELSQLEQRIAKLISQLGSEEYATREKAQAELGRLGLDAYDALVRVQDHEDIEIANRARYLVGSIRVQWIQEYDSLEVKRILRDYDSQSAAERMSRMERLASLDDWIGTEAIVRLARFENSTVLSKVAALLVLNQPIPETDQQRSLLVESIERGIGISDRTAAIWIKTHARYLVEPSATLEQWDDHVQREITLFRDAPDETSHRIVRDLLRWQFTALERLGRHAEARAVLEHCVQLRSGSPDDILALLGWLEDVSAWSVIDGVAAANDKRFERDTRLMYRWAEAQLRQGRADRAGETARKALNLPSEDRSLVARQLQKRGLFDWAEAEYRQIISNEQATSIDSFVARISLSEMLHDQQRDLEAAKVLQPASDLIENDAAALRLVKENLRRSPNGIMSRMYYFYAEHHGRQADRNQQKEYLNKGIAADETDADVLIAMYRFPDADEEWKKRTLELIARATSGFRGTIGEYRALLEQVEQPDGDPRIAEGVRPVLASAYNQLAWLVGNTEGDYQEALNCSLESLRLRPDDPGLLDTLGRCYYAMGDFENAVKFQSKALSLEPYSGQMKRQLDLFEVALKDSKDGDSGAK